MEVLKGLQSTMGAVNDIREANRGSPVFNHLTTVSEGVAVLGWITIDPKPANYITDTLGSAEFYGNRVLKEYKEKLDILSENRLRMGADVRQGSSPCRMGSSFLPDLQVS